MVRVSVLVSVKFQVSDLYWQTDGIFTSERLLGPFIRVT